MDTNIKINIPILLIIFNRPDKVRVLINALSKTHPSRIYISADGPRENVVGEKEKCAESRKIAQSISWPCEVVTNFSSKNLGCKIAVSKAITWFFSQVESGIILEDDCIPSPSFFPFCAELLERYRGDERIMHINGTTFLTPEEATRPADSYHFSRLPHIWGWATWKRAWNAYDIEMKNLENMKTDFPYASHWISLFRHVQDKNVDTWDAQWVYSIMSRKAFTITPQINLIENIGFDKEATHTHTRNASAQKASALDMPFIHPDAVAVDELSDDTVMKKVYIQSFWKKLISKFR